MSNNFVACTASNHINERGNQRRVQSTDGWQPDVHSAVQVSQGWLSVSYKRFSAILPRPSSTCWDICQTSWRKADSDAVRDWKLDPTPACAVSSAWGATSILQSWGHWPCTSSGKRLTAYSAKIRWGLVDDNSSAPVSNSESFEASSHFNGPRFIIL